jgi:hypothetical protein
MSTEKRTPSRTVLYFGALWGVAIVFIIIQALVQG